MTQSNNRRWYDPNKIVWGLFSLVGLLIIAGATMAWSTIGSNSDRIHQLERIQERTNAQYQEIIRRLDRIEKSN